MYSNSMMIHQMNQQLNEYEQYLENQKQMEMEFVDEQESWGTLVSLTEEFQDIQLTENETMIGKLFNSEFSNISFIHNKHMLIKRILVKNENGNEYIKIQIQCNSKSFTKVNNVRINCQAYISSYDEIVFYNENESERIRYIFIENDIINEDKNTSGPQHDYLFGESLGSGGYSLVRKAYHKQTNKKYAIKITKRDTLELNRMLMNEMNIIQIIKHPNLIHLENYYITPNHLYQVIEYMPGKNLLDRHNMYGLLSREINKKIIENVLKGLCYLEEMNIVHRDVKMENILFRTLEKTDTDCVLSDFGLSRRINEETHTAMTFCGTNNYIAPEMLEANLNGTSYDASKVDVFCCGVVFFFISCGYYPFNDNFNFMKIDEKMNGIQEYHFGENWNKQKDYNLIQIVKMMMNPKSSQRPSARELLDLPYFKF